MSRRPPRSTLTATLVPDTTLFRSDKRDQGLAVGGLEFGETGVDAVHCASPSPSRGRPGWGWVCCGWEETHPLPRPPLEGEGATCARFPLFTGPCPHEPRPYARPCIRHRTGCPGRTHLYACRAPAWRAG